MENIQVNEEKNLSSATSESPANRAGQASDTTRRPWEVGKDKYTIWSKSGVYVGNTYAGDDAELIVKAVNSHDALVAAAKAALKTFRHLRDNHAEAWDSTINAETCNAWDSLKAALNLRRCPNA